MNDSVPTDNGPQSPVDGAAQQTADAAGPTVGATPGGAAGAGGASGHAGAPGAPGAGGAPGHDGGLEPDGAAEAAAARSGHAHVWGPLAVYTLLRFALIVALTLLLMLFMPLIVALLFAIIVQLPLSWLLFAGPRRRLNDAMAQSSAKRRSERAKLQSALSGDEPVADR